MERTNKLLWPSSDTRNFLEDNKFGDHQYKVFDAEKNTKIQFQYNNIKKLLSVCITCIIVVYSGENLTSQIKNMCGRKIDYYYFFIYRYMVLSRVSLVNVAHWSLDYIFDLVQKPGFNSQSPRPNKLNENSWSSYLDSNNLRMLNMWIEGRSF